MPRGAQWLMAAVLALAAFGDLRAIRHMHHWGGDFSVYVSQARNISEGLPTYESSYVVTPQSARNHPAAYPPVPSWLLAPVYRFAGLNYRAFKLVLALFAWLSLPLWYAVGKRLGLPPQASAGAVLVFATGASLYPTLDTVGSDGVYLFCSAAALWALLWVEQESWVTKKPAAAAALVSSLLLLLIATRAAGLALVAAFGLWEGLRILRTRRIPSYTWWAAGMLGAGLLCYQLFLYNTASQYGNQFSLEPRLVARNVLYYLRMAAPLWSPSPAALRYALTGAVLLLGVGAWFTRLSRWGVVELYALAFAGMLSVYTVNNDSRYALPLLPLLLFFAIDGALNLGKRFWPSQPALPAALLGSLAVAAAGFNLTTIDTSPITEGVGKQSFQQVAGFLEKTSPDTLILSWNPRVFALYTRHPSALYPQEPGQPFESQLPNADHILLVKYAHALDHEKLDGYIAAAAKPVEYSNAEFTVYRIR